MYEDSISAALILTYNIHFGVHILHASYKYACISTLHNLPSYVGSSLILLISRALGQVDLIYIL